MPRYWGWDYKRPYYTMVTLRRREGLRLAFSVLDADSPTGLRPHPLTQALTRELFRLGATGRDVGTLKPFVIMPDHIHLLIRLRGGGITLPVYVRILRLSLQKVCRQFTDESGPVFERNWHDLIVTRRGQLGRVIHYILSNPREALIRRAHPDRFRLSTDVTHWSLGDTKVCAKGDVTLLNAPRLEAVRLSRSLLPGTQAWRDALAPYAAWDPGVTAVGTWWSPAETEARRLILARGGRLIHLCPHGLDRLWHPAGQEAQQLCAAGRLLYLSPYPPQGRRLEPGETRRRCLELNALALRMAEAVPPAAHRR